MPSFIVHGPFEIYILRQSRKAGSIPFQLYSMNSRYTFSLVIANSLSCRPRSELLPPIDLGRKLHHQKQRQDGANRNRKAGESLEKEGVREEHQKNKLSAARFNEGKPGVDHQSQIADEQENRDQ